jgi:deazaflavin-dependent oxidoreductase (nitroreductase family)
MARTKVNKPLTRVFSAAHRVVYRLSGGRLGSSFGAADIGLVTMRGRRSGKERTLPLIVTEHDDGWALVASASGHDGHPAWYLNLRSDPNASLQIGREAYSVRARDLEGAERDEVWARMVAVYPDYEAYQEVTDRVIPVVALDRV